MKLSLTSHELVEPVQDALLPIDCDRPERVRTQEPWQTVFGVIRERDSSVSEPFRGARTGRDGARDDGAQEGAGSVRCRHSGSSCAIPQVCLGASCSRRRACLQLPHFFSLSSLSRRVYASPQLEPVAVSLRPKWAILAAPLSITTSSAQTNPDRRADPLLFALSKPRERSRHAFHTRRGTIYPQVTPVARAVSLCSPVRHDPHTRPATPSALLQRDTTLTR